MIVARDSVIAVVLRLDTGQAEVFLDQGSSESRIVDMKRQTADRTARCRQCSQFQRVEECGIGFRIMERLSRGIDRGDASLRDEDPERRFCRFSFDAIQRGTGDSPRGWFA